MLSANELRIGNYVTPCHKFNGIVTPITDIISRVFTNEGFKCKLANDITLSFAEQECYDYPLSMIEPIPINEEWLIKFGFEKLSSDKYFNDLFKIDEAVFPNSKGEKRYDFRKKINEKESISLKYITYIHQLQNIYFALTQKELELC